MNETFLPFIHLQRSWMNPSSSPVVVSSTWKQQTHPLINGIAPPST